MKQKLTLLLLALVTSLGAWAATVQWANSFSPNDNASVYYVGIKTPGTTSDSYTMSAFSFYENSGYGAAARYTVISTAAPTNDNGTYKISTSYVLGISTNNPTPSAEGYVDYTLSTTIDLTGGTTYYMIFVTSNSATNGSYTVGTQRVRLQNNTTYTPTVMLGNGTVRSDLTPGFKATLTTTSVYTITYTCKSTADNSTIDSGSDDEVVDKFTAPTIDDYEYSYATLTDGTSVNLATTDFTEDTELYLYYIPYISFDYKLMFNNSAIKTTSGRQLLGASTAAPAAWGDAPLYCSYGDPDIATIASGTTEVKIDLLWTGPFAISSDFEHANWCYLKMHGQYLIYSGSTPYSLGDLAAAEAAGYNAFWAFVGNPVNGFQLINKAAGSDKNLVVAWFPNMGTGNTKWSLQRWNDDFALHSNNLYLNNADGQLKLWVSGQSEEATDFDCKIESASYRGLALAFIDDYADSHALGHYFGVATSTYNSVRAGYADAASVSASDYTQLVSFIGGMLPASYPETGYYRIKSNSGRYIGYGQPEADPMPSVGLRTVSAEDAAKDASTVIRLVKGVGSHQYTMITEGLNVQSMVTGNTPFPATNDAGAVFTFAALAETPGKGTICNPASNDEDNEHINGYLHEANWTVPGIVNWKAGVAPSQWEIEDAESLTVLLNDGGDGYKYATLCLPFAVTLNEACAYTLTLNDSQTGLRLSDAISAVPAGTPVLLRSASASVTASIAGDASYATTPVTSTALTGVYVDTAVASDTEVDGTTDYFLGIVSGKIGFYHWAGTTLKANRAYFDSSSLPVPVKGLVLDFEDDATSIQAIDNGRQTTDAAIYNIAGQRLNKTQKGINIVNGKKVLK